MIFNTVDVVNFGAFRKRLSDRTFCNHDVFHLVSAFDIHKNIALFVRDTPIL